MPPVTLADIRAAAERLSNAHNDSVGIAALLQAEVKNAITPIMERYKNALDQNAAAEAEAQSALDIMLMSAPHLFVKPRSLVVDGVRCGYKKAEDSLTWSDEGAVIAAIKAIKPEQAPILIRTIESLIIDALAGVDEKDLVSFGIRTVVGVDQRYITIGDNDSEKLTKIVIADAMRRQGEEEVTKTTKGKAKAKVAA